MRSGAPFSIPDGPVDAYFDLVFEATPVPLVLVDNDGTILKVNGAFATLFEHEPSALTGRAVEVLVPEKAQVQHVGLRKAYLTEPTKRLMGTSRELSGVTGTGRTVPLEIGLNPIRLGETNFTMLALMDLTAQKANETRIRQIIDASGSAIFLIDGTGQISFANETACTLFGYAPAELLGQPINKIVPERYAGANGISLANFLGAGARRRLTGVPARRSDGSEFPIDLTLTPYASETAPMAICTIVDLSEIIAAEREMVGKNNALEALNRELSSFANSVSHDLKSPLSSISGLLSLCLEDLDSGQLDQVRSGMAEAQAIAQRGMERVESLLELARADHRRITPESFSLTDELSDIWRDLTSGMPAPPAFELDLRHHEPVVGERMTMASILANLLSNAVRYADASKQQQIVAVRTTETRGTLTLRVRDNGVGMDPVDMERAFDAFTRLHQRSGNGLGLTLVRKHLDRMGGSVAGFSAPGEGSEFIVTVPIGNEVAA